ncbi:MAG: hypothetical protein LBQ44_10000 [Treponema sp.]|nr:hypothetical protein [Treponema sp.]
MQVYDAVITRLVERIGEHYRTNISNRFIRPALLQLPLDNQTWDFIEVLTGTTQNQGFPLDELYAQIMAAASFVAAVRRDLVPGLRHRIAGRIDMTGQDKVLKDMAINNFASNLQVFADLIYELYIKLVEIDKKASKGRMPLYARTPGLSEVGRHLVGS